MDDGHVEEAGAAHDFPMLGISYQSLQILMPYLHHLPFVTITLSNLMQMLVEYQVEAQKESLAYRDCT